jgi:hypothetical protein
MDRDDAVASAKQHWFRPTADGIVWAKSFAIDVAARKAEALARKQIEADWEAVFLRKQVTDVSTGVTGEADGLFFVKPAHVGVHFRESEVPAAERMLTQDWFGPRGVPGTPEGLNDCTAYVSHCLVDGGVAYLGPASPGDVWPTRSAQQIYRLLSERPASQVKRLTDMCAAAAAARVFEALAHIIKPGDVLTFAAAGRHEHAGMLVTVDAATGDARMTCHSTMDHPDLGAGEGTWQIRTQGWEHPFVSILHFSHDDPAPPAALAALAGWWKVMLLGTKTVFMHLTAGGAAAWTPRKPAGTGAPAKPAGRGHWYADAAGTGLVVVWENGAVDTLAPAADTQSMLGTEDAWPLLASRDLT